jgi:hypothetical protein
MPLKVKAHTHTLTRDLHFGVGRRSSRSSKVKAHTHTLTRDLHFGVGRRSLRSSKVKAHTHTLTRDLHFGVGRCSSRSSKVKAHTHTLTRDHRGCDTLTMPFIATLLRWRRELLSCSPGINLRTIRKLRNRTHPIPLKTDRKTAENSNRTVNSGYVMVTDGYFTEEMQSSEPRDCFESFKKIAPTACSETAPFRTCNGASLVIGMIAFASSGYI